GCLANLAQDKLNVKTMLNSNAVHAGLHEIVKLPPSFHHGAGGVHQVQQLQGAGIMSMSSTSVRASQDGGVGSQTLHAQTTMEGAASVTTTPGEHHEQDLDGAVDEQPGGENINNATQHLQQASSNMTSTITKPTRPDLEGETPVLRRRMFRNCAWTLLNVARTSSSAGLRLLPLVRASLLLLASSSAARREEEQDEMQLHAGEKG
ncbi:unnamed protein product, partial [Amoebophrya sp. A120]